MTLDNSLISILIIIIAGLSVIVLMALPFSIALFYEKTFNRSAYPYLFLLSGFLLILSFSILYHEFSNFFGNFLFASGGILLAVASLRLYTVMTGSD